jgi:hypothetical protein
MATRRGTRVFPDIAGRLAASGNLFVGKSGERTTHGIVPLAEITARRIGVKKAPL